MNVYQLKQRLVEFSDSISVADEFRHYTYRELVNIADDIGDFLLNHGASSEYSVVIDLSRSIESIFIALACFFKKIPFVFLGHQLPARKKDKLIALSSASIKVNQLDTSSITYASNNVYFSITQLALPKTIIEPPLALTNDHVAYLGTSSGSMGDIKCAVIGFKSLCYLMKQQTLYFALTPGDKVLQIANTGFDAIVSEIFVSLYAGAYLHIASVSDLELIPYINRTILQKNIDLMTITPSVAQKINPSILLQLKTLVLAGEVANKQLLKPIIGKIRIINAYGLCETTVCSHMADIVDVESSHCIGKLIKYCHARIVDENGEDTAFGSVGELWLYGDMVGYGYLGEDSNDSFWLDPKTTQRYFKTRDLVSVDSEDNYFYSGRKDSHIKIRGQKVNLIEIENQVMQLSAVDNAHAVNVDGNVVLFYQGTINKKEVYDNLKKYLSSAAFPTCIIQLKEFIVTQNGKKDLAALKRQGKEAISKHKSDDIEHKAEHKDVAQQIFETTLNRSQIPEEESFFDLGGDSLSIVDIMAKYAEYTKKDMDLTKFLKAPTLSTLRDMVSSHGYSKASILTTFHKQEEDIASWKTIKHHNQYVGDTVVLTGATGKVGFAILLSLLDKTSFSIVCLGREKISKLHSMLKRCVDSSFESIMKRIKWVTCDFSDSLSVESAINGIATISSCYALIHCAAHVNHVYDLSALYVENVESTYRLLEYVYTKPMCKFIYISSISSEYPSETNINTCSGYDLSKSASEAFINIARSKQLDAVTIKLPLVYNMAIFNDVSMRKDHFLCKLRQCQLMGLAPDLNVKLAILDASDNANMLVQLCMTDKQYNQSYLFIQDDGVEWKHCVDSLCGDSVKYIPYQQWRDLFLHQYRNGPLFPFMPMYEKGGIFEHTLFPTGLAAIDKAGCEKYLTTMPVKTSEQVFKMVKSLVNKLNLSESILQGV